MAKKKNIYVLYDGRWHSDPSEALELSTASAEEECRETPEDMRMGGVWVEYDLEGNEMSNPVERYDL